MTAATMHAGIRGRLHVGEVVDREWVTACRRTFPAKRRDIVAYFADDALQAWRLEARDGLVCRDCAERLEAARARRRAHPQ